MDTGVVNSIENDNYPYKFGAPAQQGDVRCQDSHDDGYETSNGGDQKSSRPGPPHPIPHPQSQHSPELTPREEGQSKEDGEEATPLKIDCLEIKAPQEQDIGVEEATLGESKEDLEESSTILPEESTPTQGEKEQETTEEVNMDSKMEATDDDVKPDEITDRVDEEIESKSADISKEDIEPLDELDVRDEPEAEDTEDRELNEVALENSASNSPKRISPVVLNPNEDSTASRDRPVSSPCPSNSRSDSSLGGGNRQHAGMLFDTGDNLPHVMAGAHHEDSSSQSQGYQMPRDQMDPYEMKQRLAQQYMPVVRQAEMPFGGIKREPYDMAAVDHDPYAHYKRDNDPYSRENLDPYGRAYKRPDEMFMNSYKDTSEIPYGGFGIKRDGLHQNPYAMKCDPYSNQHGFPGNIGVKREHDDMLGYNSIKRECSEDPYSFVDEEAAVCAMLGQQGNPGVMGGNPLHQDPLVGQHMMQSPPKKRGRKKKVKGECPEIKHEPGLDGVMVPIKPIKERKKHDRFNGMSEEEVCRRTLPDHLAQNLDIIIIGINPGLFAAYKGHHYAGPGNHFWKCLYLSGLTQEQMNADEDYKLLHFGIGFTNMVSRATKGSADLTRKEIKDGSQILLEKLQTFRPKIAVFNGKLIYEVFSGKKDFCFGRQPDTVHGTNTYMWVMPSSSARCAQLPRAADKVPFYSALRRFRDYLNGALQHVDEAELVFPDTTCRRPQEDNEIRRLIGPEVPCEMMMLEDGTEVPVKKKRGRPKKVKLENGEIAPPQPRAPRPPKQPPPECLNGEQPPKKKRGRPKKVRPEDQQFLNAAQAAVNVPPLPNMPLNQALGISPVAGLMDDYQGMQQRDYQTDLGLDASQMMYPAMNQGAGTQTGIPGATGQNLPVNVPVGPATSPYFSGSMGGNRNEMSPGLDTQQAAVGPGTPGGMGGMQQRSQGYGQSPGPFSRSPRPQGVGYSPSPRPPGYSQSPQRQHQAMQGYSNSPVPQAGSVAAHPYSQSPAPQNLNAPQYSQSPPLRPHSQNHNYSQPSPVPGHPYSRSPAPQNNTPTYSQQSPMFAQSPANMPHPYSQSPVPQGFSQPSPASQGVGFACRSPAPMSHSYPQSPIPQGVPYPQLSPARQTNNPSHPFSQSPVPQQQNAGNGMYSQSPGSQSQAYQQNPVRSHPYSPLLPHHPGYGQSPVQPGQNQNYATQSPPQNMSVNRPGGMTQQQYQSDLSSEISAAISSPGPSSPSMAHIDFEPPSIVESRMRNVRQETAETGSNRGDSRRTSPEGMVSGDPRHNISDSLNALGDVSHDSNDIMDAACGGGSNQMMQMQANARQLSNQNRHSALNLIGPSSSASNTSSPVPSAMDQSQNKSNIENLRAQSVYGGSNSMYNVQPGSNEAQSPVSNEQRLGFQVPTPSGSANSSYGTATPADLSNVARGSPRDVDNASVASVSSQHDRLAAGGGYPNLGSYAGDAAGSPRQTDSGLLHHAASMYGNPFSRMGSTPPHHTLGGNQASPFSSQSGGGAFRGLPLDGGQSSPQPLTVQGSTGSSGDYGSPVKPAVASGTKQQDVSSKSLSGLESLVDQIPSIADGGPALSSEVVPHAGPASVPALENPYAAHAPSLYSPYPYNPTPYGPPPVSNNGYSSALAAGPFVGYPGGHYGQLMRPTPGYLPDTLSPYHHSGYPGLPAQQYGPGAGYGPAAPAPNYSAYYNGYGPGSIPNAAANMPTYLSSHVLDHIHKNAAADSSVSFGGFC